MDVVNCPVLHVLFYMTVQLSNSLIGLGLVMVVKSVHNCPASQKRFTFEDNLANSSSSTGRMT